MKIAFRRPDVIVFESDLFRTTSTLVIRDDFLLLVDPNWLPEEVEYIHSWTASLKADYRPSFILFTHSDYDHILGYGKFTGFKTIASGRFVENPVKEQVLKQIREFDDSYYIQRDYPVTYPGIDVVVHDNGKAFLPAHQFLKCWQAPGHNPDGIICLLEDQGILITGDYLSNIEFPYVYHSVREYRDTLNRLSTILKTYPVQILIPGHGDVTTDPEEMVKRISDSQDYLDRLENSVRMGNEFDLNYLFPRYAFPGIMLPFHRNNEALMKRELEGELGEK